VDGHELLEIVESMLLKISGINSTAHLRHSKNKSTCEIKAVVSFICAFNLTS
jgi:hypothetical protein